MSIEFTLPFPPSVNSKYRMSGRKRLKGKKELEWEQKATDSLNEQNIMPFQGRCYVIYELHHPDNRERDAANYEKKVTDLLVARNILTGDDRRYIKGIMTYWNDKKGKHIIIRIVPIDNFHCNLQNLTDYSTLK